MIARAAAVLSALWWAVAADASPPIRESTLLDASRGRPIPVAVAEPAPQVCRTGCPVLVFGTGYRASATSYGFLLTALAEAGFVAVAVQHDLPGDDPIPNTGDLFRDRSPFWARGAQSIVFVIDALAQRQPQHDWARPVLAGHSQGGDIAALLGVQGRLTPRALVTLDNRRVPLPRRAAFPTLSLRSSDQPADAGVLPEAGESPGTVLCLVRLSDTRHDDMDDGGSDRTKHSIADTVVQFLRLGACPTGQG